MLNVC